MHRPASDLTGLGDQPAILLANLDRLGLGPGQVVAELLLHGPEGLGQADALGLGVIGPAASDGVAERLVGG